jgi:transcriptional regulator with XRE-family HTH domain
MYSFSVKFLLLPVNLNEQPAAAGEGAGSVDAGARLAAERKRLGLTQEALATVMSVKRQAVYAYEAGKRVPDLAQLAALHRLGANVHFIVTGARSVEFDPIERARFSDALRAAQVYAGAPSIPAEVQERWLKAAWALFDATRDQ